MAHWSGTWNPSAALRLCRRHRTGQDALALDTYGEVDAIITNPPYTRPLIRAQIWHFARSLPTWLLIKTDWASAGQAAPFTLLCSDIVLVGPLRHRGGGCHPRVATRGYSYAPRPE